MSFLDETLKRLGIESYEEMTDVEKSTYDSWLRQMSADLTVSDIRTHVENMKNAVVIELSDEPEFIHSKIFPFLKRHNPKNIQLKARLKNYILLASFLATPEQAREALEKSLQQLDSVV